MATKTANRETTVKQFPVAMPKGKGNKTAKAEEKFQRFPAKAVKGDRVVKAELSEAMLLILDEAMASHVSSWRVVKGSKFAKGEAKPIRLGNKKDGYTYTIKGGTGKGIGGGKAAALYAEYVLEQGYSQAEAIAKVTNLFKAILAVSYRIEDELKTVQAEDDNFSYLVK